MNPQFPVFVISKGRADSRLTVKALEWMKVPYHVVVEPQEFDQYAAVINPKNILTTPFSNLGQGSIPVRNFIWEHSTALGAKAHWCLDDNISGFVRLHENSKVQFSSGTCFRLAEEFMFRYENVAIAGFHYDFFAKRKQKLPPLYLNRRIYSCILIRNDIPYRWRGRYNEDTDLSLRVLKDGWCTVLFLAFLACKAATLTMKGGNSSELYAGASVLEADRFVVNDADKYAALKSTEEEEREKDGRYLMAKSLCEQHPDVSRISTKFGRWQHHVDYSPFKYNQPKLRKGIQIPEVCPYELELRQIGEPQ